MEYQKRGARGIVIFNSALLNSALKFVPNPVTMRTETSKFRLRLRLRSEYLGSLAFACHTYMRLGSDLLQFDRKFYGSIKSQIIVWHSEI